MLDIDRALVVRERFDKCGKFCPPALGEAGDRFAVFDLSNEGLTGLLKGGRGLCAKDPAFRPIAEWNPFFSGTRELPAASIV